MGLEVVAKTVYNLISSRKKLGQFDSRLFLLAGATVKERSTCSPDL